MIVAFINNSALSLDEVERDETGAISRAWVINGYWTLIIKDGEALACEETSDGIDIVTRWPIKTIEEFAVRNTGDYNNDIARARKRKLAGLP